METLLLYALITPSLFYLGSRAVITGFLWRRYPSKLAHFMDCSACSGTWYGAIVGYIGGYHAGLDFLGMSGAHPLTVAAVALGSMTWTPIVAGLVQLAFDRLGSAVEPEPETVVEPLPDEVINRPDLPSTSLPPIAGIGSAYGATVFGAGAEPVDVMVHAMASGAVPLVHHISPAPLGGYVCSCGQLFSPSATVERKQAVAALDQALRHDQAMTVFEQAIMHADEANKVSDGSRAG